MNDDLLRIRDMLIERAKTRLAELPSFLNFTGNKDADALLNDLEEHPHAFVTACIMDRQMRAEKAWLIPYRLSERLGYFDFPGLARTSLEKLRAAMHNPAPLHRFPDDMACYLHLGIQRIGTEYGGNASRIWAGEPPSATIVRRFLEFEGVGPKIATMAANILVREFRIPVSDRYSIDISADVQVRRVFARLGFVPENATPEYLVYRARELWPEYPGIFDAALWELGREICHSRVPLCDTKLHS